jgi:hypothetical protein
VSDALQMRGGIIVWRSRIDNSIKAVTLDIIPFEPSVLGYRGDIAATVEAPILATDPASMRLTKTVVIEALKKKLRTDSSLKQIYAYVYDQWKRGHQKPEFEVVEEDEWRKIMEGA